MHVFTKLAGVTIIVRDQDEALRWYTEKLGLEVRSDDAGTVPGFRWVTVGVKGRGEPAIILFKPGFFQDEEATKIMLGRVGQGTMWVFHTDDCRKEHKALSSRGVKFIDKPQEVPWGVQAIFEDLYGNQFLLLQPR